MAAVLWYYVIIYDVTYVNETALYAHVHYDTRVPCQNGLRRRAMCKTQNYFAVSESTMMESEDFNIEEKGSELIEQQ